MLKIGADPEFWLVRRDTGRPVSAHELEWKLGTKTAPRRLDYGGSVQVDGTAVEFNIVPASNPREFAENMRGALNEVRMLIPNQYVFNFNPYRTYTPAMWKKIPDKSKEIGCDPEEYAFYKPWIKRTKMGERSRGAGGHIHFGWTEGKDKDDNQHKWDCKYFAQFLSRNLSSKIQRLIGYSQMDIRRLELTGYGAKDAYRVKPYGMEYRALSSRWVARPDVWEDVFNICHALYDRARGENMPCVVSVPYPEEKVFHSWME